MGFAELRVKTLKQSTPRKGTETVHCQCRSGSAFSKQSTPRKGTETSLKYAQVMEVPETIYTLQGDGNQLIAQLMVVGFGKQSTPRKGTET